ncbi:uncharacterized protein LOC110925137 [Helianthus annuus]|uniref:uncharacterized protein LOC110925137 n=1 Tax=Helianthus annuus TaxID=4232 RepID=UPI0016533CB4|nr:uncharacterized protein LOC110925137 [Helianthus annuus]
MTRDRSQLWTATMLLPDGKVRIDDLELHHVLDLCAAPGAKLCMILELLGNSGFVTGADMARHRLAACRTLVQKYLHVESRPGTDIYGRHFRVVGLSKTDLFKIVSTPEISLYDYDKCIGEVC